MQFGLYRCLPHEICIDLRGGTRKGDIRHGAGGKSLILPALLEVHSSSSADEQPASATRNPERSQGSVAF